ncbi:hypothetical protein NM688_g2477 [Phlebia brevispora]|uniref:Uncharacterized protein n=1 Tax=Phlebia brevispora TaxID=194682 RepID=A0ACC1T891_9APHY|nr:hypothetical protein NM688_g2477 [Phlebia brevispora]
MAVDASLSFDDFVDRITGKFGKSSKSLGMKFKDEDGAKVTLRDESDYELAIETARDNAKGKPEGKLEICETWEDCDREYGHIRTSKGIKSRKVFQTALKIKHGVLHAGSSHGTKLCTNLETPNRAHRGPYFVAQSGPIFLRLRQARMSDGIENVLINLGALLNVYCGPGMPFTLPPFLRRVINYVINSYGDSACLSASDMAVLSTLYFGEFERSVPITLPSSQHFAPDHRKTLHVSALSTGCKSTTISVQVLQLVDARIAETSRDVVLCIIGSLRLLDRLVYVALASAAAVDIAIGLAQCRLLHQRWSSSSSIRSSLDVCILALRSVNTGLLTRSACAACCLATHDFSQSYYYDCYPSSAEMSSLVQSDTEVVYGRPVEIIIGPPHIANLALSLLFGITIAQTYTYYGRKKEMQDGLLLRCLVALLWVLDAFHFAIVSSAHYHYVINNYGQSTSIQYLTWRSSTIVLVTACSDLIVRSIFICRIRALSVGNVMIVVGLCIGSLVNFCASIAFASHTYLLLLFREYDMYSWMVYIALASAAVVDVALAFTQCLLLKRHQKRSSSTRLRSSSVIRTLMLYSINTGLLTSICAICCLVTYVTMRWNHIYDVFYWLSPTLYLNALLATLNARKGLRKSLEGQVISLPVIEMPSNLLTMPSMPAASLLSWGETLTRDLAEPAVSA